MATTTLDSQHQDMIHDAQLDYYGKRLATCSSDKTIKIFDVGPKAVPVKVADLIGHDGPVWEVDWCNPKLGNFLASCSYDRKVIIWKEEKSEWVKFYEYTGHDLSVNSVAWAPHELGLMLACGSSDGSISILSWKDNEWHKTKFKAHESGVNAISWAPAAAPYSLLSQTPDNSYRPRFVSGGCDHMVKIWTQLNHEWKQEVIGQHDDWVRDVAWAPNMGLPSSTIASCAQDGSVIIWTQSESSPNWVPNKILPLKNGSNNPPVVWRVSWSLTGNLLAVSGAANNVTLWKESASNEWQCISQIDENEIQE
jgi:protein transport protein SEC13